jgi:hypothetical protein
VNANFLIGLKIDPLKLFYPTLFPAGMLLQKNPKIKFIG